MRYVSSISLPVRFLPAAVLAEHGAAEHEQDESEHRGTADAGVPPVERSAVAGPADL
jgi:hypothetical protein